ncbi:hypothetical protein BDA96_10G063100 [Sorghum bicolor]|uniref:DUF569 domain-containing protein n=2 Tax=Sorghum bicolor TaxID=4558 RepID=A0A921TZ34_SORBI|nr:uncharacterized protein LOC8070894 [Sorghum bicolor]KAG0512997.1 hypothetical protein BDA96_10G063100 [Sorghum bicolor]KXG19394.1 hypothetical protein SORBI_3010G053500 [Sorghum bicolor]|eukprot:XP_021305128.1 uncharacterized protein LOC8070894 [Sorghum bicolor]
MLRGAGRQQLPPVSAMDLFPDGAFVRLRNRVQQTYLYADDDGEGVSLRPHGPAFSLNAVWRVHRVDVDGTTLLLLQGAAYGRYLAISPAEAESGDRGNRAVQRDYGGDDQGALMWRPFRMVDDARYVRLRHDFNRNLRANGKFRFWRTAVTVDTNEGRWTTMMQWTVGTFQLGPELPPLPHPTVNLGGRRGLFRRRRLEADERRTIRHVRANDQGEFDPNNNNWATFHFYGRSVFNLRMQVGIRQDGGAGEYGDGITLAVQPGLHGRLTPLVTDLPRSVDPMDIVVFNTGSQGAQNLVHPDIA